MMTSADRAVDAAMMADVAAVAKNAPGSRLGYERKRSEMNN
jgi:hypothetical protein